MHIYCVHRITNGRTLPYIAWLRTGTVCILPKRNTIFFHIDCSRTSTQATVTVAVQRIGSFFNSENDICLWMYYLREDEFKSRLTAVLFSILATPLSAIELRESYKQTRQILQAHVYGLDMLSAVGRAKLHRNNNAESYHAWVASSIINRITYYPFARWRLAP